VLSGAHGGGHVDVALLARTQEHETRSPAHSIFARARVLHNAADHHFEDFLRPARAEQVRLREPDEEITK
jgi:hypothetical protein